ncbi:MAG: murein biosynthesis integral membrane protein MurJ [Dehalococcoidia bacterium]
MREVSRRGALARFLQRSTTSQSVAAAAGVVAFGFVASRLLGLLRSVAIARAFGTDPELSAYWVAFRLPDLVFQVLAGATLSAAFIPTYSRVRLRFGEQAGWDLAAAVLNLISVATTLAAVLAFVLAPWLVPLLAPGLGAETGREAELRSLAVELTRVMLLSPILFGVSGMVTGILNARSHFLAPALAPVFYNLAIIASALFLAGPWGVQGLAVGVVAGSALHLVVQIPALQMVGMRWRPTFDIAAAGVGEVARLMGPRVVGLAAAQLNFVVVVFFASFVSDEAISALNYAFLMAMLPVGVVGMAISTAVFPSMAQQAAARQISPLRDSVARSLRLILFLAIPASAGLALLAEPAVRLAFERGAFDAASSDLVWPALVIYGLAVFAHAGIEIASRGYYALSDTRTPVQFAVLSVLVNVALCAAFVSPFGLRGLAAATSIAATVEFLLLVAVLERRLGGLRQRRVGGSVLRTLAATIVMSEVIVLLTLLIRAAGVDAHSFLGALLLTAGVGGAGLFAFAYACTLVRSEEYRELTARLRG